MARLRSHRTTVSDPGHWVSHLQVKSLAAELHRRTGIVTPKEKMVRVQEALLRIHTEQGLSDIEETRALILKNSQMWQTFVNAMTINESYLFRDKKLLEVFTKKVLLPMATEHKNIRIWSAACSTGDEASTLALLCQELEQRHPFLWTIDGSDIDTEAVELAQALTFEMRQLKDTPQRLLFLYFEKTTDGRWRVIKKLRERLRFFHHNLMDSRSELEVYDVVFLRNVLIYFDGEKRREVIARLREAMKPGGYLFLGHAESLPDQVQGWIKHRQGDVSYYEHDGAKLNE